MQAEIITIGDEILIGQVVDTNSAWIACRLNDSGIALGLITSIRDDAGEITAAVDAAFARSQIVVVTGGLGPTNDDITKKTLAEYFRTPLVRHQPSYDFIEKMLAARGVEFNALNRRQADLPRDCEVLPNRNGTAPGMYFDRNGSVLVSLPGVPFEMMALFDEQVLPRLRGKYSLAPITHKTAVTFGLAESVLAETIAGWESALPPLLKLAYLPASNHIRLRLSAYNNASSAAGQIDAAFDALQKIIPKYFLGFEPVSVESAVAQLLVGKGATLSVAESCTGGYIASLFTSMAGASDYFEGGVTSYSNSVKEKILGVKRETLERFGAVSEEVAREMAQGVRRITGSDYSIATTGIAGPTGAVEGKPVGTVCMAVATPGGVFSKRMVFGKLRRQNIERSSAVAVNMLRLHLLGLHDVKSSEGVL